MTIKTNTVSDYAGSKEISMQDVLYGTARAWVNFNGTGVVAIRDSYNVSSITDNGTGDYTVNFTNAMVNANYCVTGNNGSGGVSTVPTHFRPSTISTSAVRFAALFTNGGATGAYDPDYCFITAHGD